MKIYYFKNFNKTEFTVRANNIVEATAKADVIAAETTGYNGCLGQAFFSGTVVDCETDEIYHKGVCICLWKDSEKMYSKKLDD
ncbi:MAG: hypothetical protein AAF915_17620 [Cyanobacteria bacterium P01_D01_bin.50]